MTFALRLVDVGGLSQLHASYAERQKSMGQARALAAQRVCAEIERKGIQDIAQAGNFSSRWTGAWTARATPDDADLSQQIVIETYFDGGKFQGKNGQNYAHIFEFGGIIKAKNPSGLLWIPLSFAGIQPGTSASEYAQQFGGLFRVDRVGKAPLLLSLSDKQPTYFGVPQVTEPKKFHLREIGTAAAAQFSSFYSQAMKAIS